MELDQLSKCYRLSSLKVDPKKLLLDPHNPRISLLLNNPAALKDDASIGSKAIQAAVFSVLMRPDFVLGQLVNSIRARGFTNAGEQMIVEKFGVNGCYLVLEGNRRTAALKCLRAAPELLSPAVRESTALIDVQEFTFIRSQGGLSKRDIIETLLGQIHISGKVSWGAMERAEYVYQSYCRLSGVSPDQLNRFSYEPTISRKVAEIFDCSLKDVRKTLIVARNYIYLRSLGAAVTPDHYTLIELATTMRAVNENIFGISEVSFHFSKPGALIFARMCVEEGRHIHNPPDFRIFAKVAESGDRDLLESLQNGNLSIRQAAERLQRIADRDQFEDEVARALEIAQNIPLSSYRGNQRERRAIQKLIELVDKCFKPLLRE